ncbi:hypothetical protein N7495_009438 [Penicillium taxi]|uniref:uncharacterized protein n=1 Tax=Penicillium taxi TaxID=168475 RepID=UPI002544E11A|nr:uncharacterized protein N7495_009438 [Penicillium taxi]KAJ5884928.1 hypothetical protein N7495_009438 [Penicillium taxi]
MSSTMSSDDWENFSNNLATDLAPLITLFGEQITKQFLSESISLLDNIIFALSPLGVLTAVVSVIRVCGSSSLRAFIGRAQEGPAEAENELLPCVSESTAELFNDGGISRVFGRPKIVEIVAWESKDENTGHISVKIGTLRDALNCGAWSAEGSGLSRDAISDPTMLPELDIPNLSLNKGIKRRNQIWFYCTAVIGAALQVGVIIFAAITVFVFPESFQTDKKAVPSYAFPLYLIGTVFLFMGMLYCAIIIERSSKEYKFKPTCPSKLLWLQSGNQDVGDQVFNSFLAVKEGPKSCMTTRLQYIKSVRVPKYNGRYLEIYSTLFFTMVGFIFQFIGERGLHASVILSQLGCTLLMSILRTCLRTERMKSDENKIRGERELLSQRNQELESFAFYLENVTSFTLVSPMQSTQSSYIPVPRDGSKAKALIETRVRLAEITSNTKNSPSMPWDHIPIRRVAQNLASALQETIELVSSWGANFGEAFTFHLQVDCDWETENRPCHSREKYPIEISRGSDTLQWKMNVNQLEAVLGLWIWSLCKSSQEWHRSKLNRLVGLTHEEASKEETDAYFYKWIFRQTEAKMAASSSLNSPSQLFGPDSDKLPCDLLMVQTDNSLEVMAAQDLYSHFLGDILNRLKGLNDEVRVVIGAQNSFMTQSDRIDDLVRLFETNKLGSREDALLCIVPNMKLNGHLPELAANSTNVKKCIDDHIKKNEWKEALLLARWISERSVGSEFEHSVYELGNICRRAMLEGNRSAQEVALEQCKDLLSSDVRAKFFASPRRQRPSGWMQSDESEKWWRNFSMQLGWVLWGISQNAPQARWLESSLEALSVPRKLESTKDTEQDTEICEHILQRWLTYTEDDIKFDHEPLGDEDQHIYKWALESERYAILYFFLTKWAQLSSGASTAAQLGYLIASENRSEWVMKVLIRYHVDIDARDFYGLSALLNRARANDTEGVRLLLANGAAINGFNQSARPIDVAAYEGHNDMIELLLDKGAEIENSIPGTSSALDWACDNGQIHTVQWLLDHGAYVNSLGIGGRAPLHSAVQSQSLELVKVLIKAGAKLNLIDNSSNTPLSLAAALTDMEILRFLVASGADLELATHFERNELEMARQWGRLDAAAIMEEELQRRQDEPALPALHED